MLSVAIDWVYKIFKTQTQEHWKSILSIFTFALVALSHHSALARTGTDSCGLPLCPLAKAKFQPQQRQPLRPFASRWVRASAMMHCSNTN
jgi:hypothetical protein